MKAFIYNNGNLYAEDVSVKFLAEEYGTPLYVYSRNYLREQYRSLINVMAEVNPLICYSVKANSNASVLKTFLNEGAGFDVVSGGELFRALKAGADASKIVFAGVGKTGNDIEYAIKQNILFFTVESEPEAIRISQCAEKLGIVARIAFRINPDVDPQTHKYISTGKKENKFGLDLERAVKAYEMVAGLPYVEIVGLHMHIGSQLLSAEPFSEALAKIKDICIYLKSKYSTFRYLDIGGGIGIKYKSNHEPLSPEIYAENVVPLLKNLDLSVIMEPGRYLVGNSGILVCEVQYIKKNAFKTFVIVDAGMNDLIRPSLYSAYHNIIPINETCDILHGDLVGPICESGDFIAMDRDLPLVKEGDFLAIASAGAYGFTMASNYNSRPKPIEIMVDKEKSLIVRKRETWDDLVAGEYNKN